jgi:D-amino-acid oxidase
MGKGNVTVIGAGVSGLTTAAVLQEQGYAVTILTEKLPHETTSAVAAAIWFPYKANPREKVNQWSRTTYHRLQNLAATHSAEAGVYMVDLLELPDRERPWWLPALPEGAARKALPKELPDGFRRGYFLHVPMIETQQYLPWLMARFQRQGGKVEVRKVDALQPLLQEADHVVNCTGLGARELVGDKSMFPIQGQIVKAEPVPGCKYIAADRMAGALPFEASYVFPRRDCIILGGTAIKGEEALDWNEDHGKRLIARCQALEPRLQGMKIQAQMAGLRPGRTSIRLARQGRILHNYGHGGAGFTVSWGCAMEVARLLETSTGAHG